MLRVNPRDPIRHRTLHAFQQTSVEEFIVTWKRKRTLLSCALIIYEQENRNTV